MTKVNPVKRALDLSHQILKSIESHDFDRVSELDSERDEFIKLYYQQPEAMIDKNLVIDLKKLNDQIIAQLIELQQQTRAEQIKLSQSQKASNAYLENT